MRRCEMMSPVSRPDIHFHDGDAGFGVAVGNGPLNRRRAAIFRQQRRMDVQTAMPRQIQNCRRQNLSVSHHNDEVGFQFPQFGDEFFVAGAFGLQHGQAQPQRERFDG